MSKGEKLVKVAVITSSYGIAGKVKMKCFLEDPKTLTRYQELFCIDGRILRVCEVKEFSKGLIVGFHGINDRNLAKELQGMELFVDRFLLPPIEENEFYHCDLLNLFVYNELGKKFGMVVAVHNFGAGDFLEIMLEEKKTVCIPFTFCAVPEIDFKAKILRINSQAAGIDLFPGERNKAV